MPRTSNVQNPSLILKMALLGLAVTTSMTIAPLALAADKSTAKSQYNGPKLHTIKRHQNVITMESTPRTAEYSPRRELRTNHDHRSDQGRRDNHQRDRNNRDSGHRDSGHRDSGHRSDRNYRDRDRRHRDRNYRDRDHGSRTNWRDQRRHNDWNRRNRNRSWDSYNRRDRWSEWDRRWERRSRRWDSRWGRYDRGQYRNYYNPSGYRSAYNSTIGINFTFGQTGYSRYRWASTPYSFYRPGNWSYASYRSATTCERIMVEANHYDHVEIISVKQCYNPMEGYYIIQGSERVVDCIMKD